MSAILHLLFRSARQGDGLEQCLLHVAAGDALVLFVIAAAYGSGRFTERSEETRAITELVSLAATSFVFWLAVVLFNAILFAGIVFSILQVRRLRASPHFNQIG